MNGTFFDFETTHGEGAFPSRIRNKWSRPVMCQPMIFIICFTDFVMSGKYVRSTKFDACSLNA